jgi:hypothetical protein
MTLIAAAMSAPCLMLGLIQSVMHQDGRMLGRVVAAVPGSALLTFAAVAVTRMLLGATDQMSLWLIHASGHQVGAFGAKLAEAVVATPGVSAFVVFMISTLTAICALVLWIELLVRAALVYVLLGFFPLMAVMMIWPATSAGIRRLVRLLIAVILSKVVIVGVVAMGVTAASESGASDRFEGLLVGTAVIGIACFAPMAVHRLLPILEEAVHVRGNLSAGGASRTALQAHSTYSAGRNAMSGLRAARAQTSGGSGAAGAAPRPRAGGSSSAMPVVGGRG